MQIKKESFSLHLRASASSADSLLQPSAIPSRKGATVDTEQQVKAVDGRARGSCLEELFKYPLMSALVERRTRRIARGVSIEAGDLSYRSPNAPHPLDPLEEAVLVLVATGVV